MTGNHRSFYLPLCESFTENSLTGLFTRDFTNKLRAQNIVNCLGVLNPRHSTYDPRSTLARPILKDIRT